MRWELKLGVRNEELGIYGAPAEVQRRQPRVRWGESEQWNERAFAVRRKRTNMELATMKELGIEN